MVLELYADQIRTLELQLLVLRAERDQLAAALIEIGQLARNARHRPLSAVTLGLIEKIVRDAPITTPEEADRGNTNPQ